ncbi:hypothetical protein [Streptomyces pacificus]|uniref:Uncharacterized protein n=1 Tax=Streptomyces pacificus TaxID=2705029 RepID=A0A6A0B1R5_9ACTN|nr:hypothetical protein [Streptomyces pacificus]GFH38214.1 hypothetical protein SCWH03_44560 [Streptomyces pacificus]
MASEKSVPSAVTGIAAVVILLAVAAVAGNFAWNAAGNGAPYPSADPDAVAQRLTARSDEVYDGFALQEKHAAGPGRVVTGACYSRGLRGIAHIDEARSDVRSFGLDWSVPDVPEATAREAQQRVRGQLVRQGWRLTHEGDRAVTGYRQLGFRFEDPADGYQVDVRWNESTTTLFVSVYAPCAQVPTGFVEHGWPEADWRPTA